MPESSQLPVAAGHRPGRPGRGPSTGKRQNNNFSSGPGSRPGRGLNQSGHADALPVGWVRLAVTVAARGVLFSILGMLTWALLPIVLGWTPTTVMTGSMEPRIHPGDVVVSRPAEPEAITLNRILLVDDPDHAGRLRLHRFADFAPDGNLILRGDANSANDSTSVAPAAVRGVAVLRVPFVGLPVVWIADRNWGPLAAVLATVAGLTLAAASGSSTPGRPEPRRREKTREMPRGPRRALQPLPSGAATRRRRHPSVHGAQTVQTILAVAAIPVLVAAALMTASPAHAAFSATAPTRTSNFSALGSYPCLSDLPPAYLADKPSLFYAFQETSGPVGDASGNERHGDLNGTTTRVAGSCGPNDSPALTLGGSPGYVSTPTAITAPNVFTVEIWFKTPLGSTTGGRLIGFGNVQIGNSSVSDRHLYMTNTGAIAFGAAPNPGNSTNYKASGITGSSAYNDGAWHQATATMSSSGMKLYLDGTLVKQSNVSSGADILGYWRIGYDAMNTNSWAGVTGNPIFAGTIDNAAVYPSALSATKVKAHYAAGH
jgi:hypothetical protein